VQIEHMMLQAELVGLEHHGAELAFETAEVQTEHSTLHFELTERDHDGAELEPARELLEPAVEALGAELVRGEIGEVAQELIMTEPEPEAA
jgi:hypothetical protein